jgi:RNA polymerase sigma-70 factor (ECF subfamily)
MEASKDSHEQFVALLAKHERVLRAYIRSAVRRPEDVDEVMQNVSIVAWRKFDSMTDTEGFASWASVIARYEILKFQRSCARDRLFLNEDLASRILEENEREIGAVPSRLDLLEQCLSRLPERSRELVLQSYAPGRSIQGIALRMGKSPDALYQLLRRIRLELMRCVEQRLGQEGARA